MKWLPALFFVFALPAIGTEISPVPNIRLPIQGLPNPVKFDFQAITVSQVIGLVYMEALKQPYVIDPAVLRDDRQVSFRFDSGSGDLHQFWKNFLDALGFAVETRNGVDFIATKKTAGKTEPTQEVFVYRTRYRPLSYIVGLLTPIFKVGNFTVNRQIHAPAVSGITGTPSASAIAPQGSAASMIDQDSDTLIFHGTTDEITLLKKLLPQVDTAVGEVSVKAVVYEVSTGKKDGTAFSLALNILGRKIGINLGDPSSLANAVTIKTNSIDAVFSALAGDTRFKAVSTPNLRVKSGIASRIMVGQDVPTLGSVSYPQGGGQPIQSITYRSSGVILGLTAQVRESGIDLQVDQQISDFVKTETGVNDSPTLTKRELSTTVTVGDGELIVLGGLTQEKDNESTSGLSFLPKVFHSSSKSDSKTEILLLLQVSKIVNP
ncbi:type II secretion system protein GspD [Undibacterium crateris]|uniref:type II secretion system protein GspD n=1 Tax=Undibacterium crateris TaxID=2528175 RepID=UPI001389899A|nr:type II secretory pathway protein [Undibacterium crateris]NDI84614.1 type II secretory pathway protein [Undibacterium crateris]